MQSGSEIRPVHNSVDTVNAAAAAIVMAESRKQPPAEPDGGRKRSGELSVSLAGPDGRVVGGVVAAMLRAASPIQLTSSLQLSLINLVTILPLEIEVDVWFYLKEVAPGIMPVGENLREDYPIARHPEFRYKTEFQSHEPEFDYLKSLEIEEKINKIKWCQTANNALFLLSTNDKTIKYWKVQGKKVKRISVMTLDTSQSSDNGTTSSCSSTSSSRALLPNGECSEKLYNCPNKDFPFPTGGCASLRLPVVVVLDPSSVVLYSMIHQQCMHIYTISFF